MDSDREKKISKYLSYYLRHHPDKLGLTLAPGGWVEVEELLAAARRNGFAIARSHLEAVVANNDKQRFSFDASGTRIRANQGHSVAVDLELEKRSPPDILYHGTHSKVADRILATGLQKMSRHHVHLSEDMATAKKVGQRRGKPILFSVDAAAMLGEGFEFYRSSNGVWLVDSVPPQYLRQL